MSSGSHLKSTSMSPDFSSVLLPRTYRNSEQFKKYVFNTEGITLTVATKYLVCYKDR